MKIYEGQELSDTDVLLHLNKDEAKTLHHLLEISVNPATSKPVRKNTKAYKLAKKISENLPIW